MLSSSCDQLNIFQQSRRLHRRVDVYCHVVQLNLQIAFYQIFHRNIDKDMAWLLPLLVDKASMIKAQIFVFWKDTADILGRKITNGTKTYR